MIRLIALMALVACSDKTDDTAGADPDTDDAVLVDADQDGYTDDVDCDDGDPSIHPDADELCDGIDQDCDAAIDDSAVDAATWYVDADNDGYGSDDLVKSACQQPSGYVAATESPDCDDGDAAIHPDAAETCNGVDDDCDGAVDDDPVDMTAWYPDADGDGFPQDADAQVACDPPLGHVALPAAGFDCDDADSSVFPDAAETCNGLDDDCDGGADEDDAVDQQTWYYDADEDGYGDETLTTDACDAPAGYVAASATGFDCDDGDALFNPGAEESDCTDPNDYNCDGSVGATDGDADGYYACEECDDADAAINPAATEICDGQDNDCSGGIDDDDSGLDMSTTTAFFADSDGDGFGDATTTVDACDSPSGYITDDQDCDDTDSAVNPDATEVCDGVDNNCDGDTDDDDAGLDATTTASWYDDDDGDGFGDALVSTDSCDAPSGYVDDDTDCDDTASGVYPGADEYCDSVDEDCDGTADNDPVDGKTYYLDDDSDGYGDPDYPQLACSRPSGYAGVKRDCDDSDAAVNPAATEFCDSVDNNCDGDVDEDDADDVSTWYADGDGDGFGDSGVSDVDCYQPTGYVADSSDCDDDESEVNPGEDETCDSVDNDCDGTIDEDDAIDVSSWYADDDSDGYGDDSVSATACDQPSGFVADGGDCDDTVAEVNPDGTETCNDGYDNDCDGSPGDCAYEGELSLSDAAGIWTGEAASDAAGRRVRFAGDVDGDGLDDIMVGAWKADSNGSNAGSTYLLLGPATQTASLSTATAELTGASSADYSGFALSTAGDQDIDGFDDLLIGAYGANTGDTDAGAAYIVLGPVSGEVSLSSADGTIEADDKYQYLGIALTGGGDVDGDAFADLLIAGTGQSGVAEGIAWLFAGPVTSDVTLAAATATLTGSAAGENAGRAVSMDGDLDGDGHDDVVVGAHSNDDAASNAGATYVLYGPVSGSVNLSSADVILQGASTNEYSAWAVDIAGDLDGDGNDDLVVGAFQADDGATNGGTTYVFYGPLSLGTGALSSLAVAAFTGVQLGDKTGYAVAGVGDVDGDSYGDLLIGGAEANTSATDAGGAWLVLGPVSGSMSLSSADAVFEGIAGSDEAGISVDGGGDVDGDSFADMLIGAHSDDTADSNAGAAYLVLGLGY